MRTAQGYKVISEGGPIGDILQAVSVDPWSADLTLGAAIALGRTGYANESSILLSRFIAIAPNSTLAKGIRR
jgi:hypothetical protein